MSRNYSSNRDRDFDSDDDGGGGGGRGGSSSSGGGGGNDRNDRGGDRGGRGGSGGGGGRGRIRRRKVCGFCRDKVDLIDFKDVRLLQNYTPERGKIIPRRISGSCATHQRMLAEAIKRARNIAFLPYAVD